MATECQDANASSAAVEATADIARDDAQGKSDASVSNKPPSVFGILGVAFLCVFVDFLGLSISIPILPFYILELPWDEKTTCPSFCPQDAATTNFAVEGRCGEVDGCGTAMDVGFCASAFYGGQILGNLMMSWLTDRIGRKPIVMASLVGSALGYLWCGLAPNLYHMYLGRLFTGMAGGTLPVVQAMILDVTGDPRERPKYFGIAGSMLGMAFMVGPGLGAGLAAGLGKQWGLCCPAIIATAVILVGIFKIHETRPKGGLCGPRSPAAATFYDASAADFDAFMKSLPQQGPPPNFKAGLPRIVYACAAAMALGAFSFTAMTSMTALTWPLAYNRGANELGVFLTFVGAIGIFNNVVVIRKVIAKIGPEKTILIAASVLGVGISCYTFIDLLAPGNEWLFIPYLLFFTFCICVPWDFHMSTLITIAGNHVPPHLRGKTTGLVAAGMSTGFALCPLVSGVLFRSDILRVDHEYGSFSHSMWLICGVLNIVEFCVLAQFAGFGQKQVKATKLKAEASEETVVETGASQKQVVNEPSS